MSNWQPIETAPKDGTHVLVFDNFGICIASFNEMADEWFVRFSEYTSYPTHWMPLPKEPPKGIST